MNWFVTALTLSNLNNFLEKRSRTKTKYTALTLIYAHVLWSKCINREIFSGEKYINCYRFIVLVINQINTLAE